MRTRRSDHHPPGHHLTCWLLALATACTARQSLRNTRPRDAEVPRASQADAAPAVVGRARRSGFAGYVLDAGEAVLAAALDRPHDPRWDSAEPGRDLRGTPVATRATARALGPDPQLVATVLFLDASPPNDPPGAPDPANEWHIRAPVVAFADGRVRWTRIAGDGPRMSQGELLDPIRVERLAPELIAFFRDVQRVQAGPCDLPTATAAELAVLPPMLQFALVAEGAPPRELCGRPSVGSWPRFREFLAVARSGERFVVLGSVLVDAGDHLALGPVHATSIR